MADSEGTNNGILDCTEYAKRADCTSVPNRMCPARRRVDLDCDENCRGAPHLTRDEDPPEEDSKIVTLTISPSRTQYPWAAPIVKHDSRGGVLA